MDTDSERASHNKCLALPYLLFDRIQQAFTQLFFLVFFLRVASKINARHYGDLCSTEMGGNTSMKLTAFLPQSQIMVLCYEFVAVGGSDSSGFYCCSCFFIKRDLFSILNV